VKDPDVTLGDTVVRRPYLRHIFCILFFLAGALSLRGQSACPTLQAPVPDPSTLLFSPQQEMELGEIIRQQLESEFLVIQEDRVTSYLQRIGDRVASHLPQTGLHFQFLLYERPEIQAFGMPGGRIYVSRKMVAFLRSEDELAGLLGHELGHLVARQAALELSREFREVLGINNLPPDDDLFARYNQYVDSARLKKRSSHPTSEEDKNQQIADSLGVQAVARAGYSPQAFPDFLDRLLETRGKTGSWLSDLFGATRPDVKRLREALRDVANLPAACIEAKSPTRTQDFSQWQLAVLHYEGIGHPEHLTGVLTRMQLENPLRGDVEHFRFSPDGKYLLAQDEGGIYVLNRNPLNFLFRIDAANAQHAQFSPDSRQVTFFSAGLRVDTWDIDSKEQSSITDVPVLHGCRQTELSPDAKYLACFGESLDLSLFNVATGEVIFKKEKFFDFDIGYGGANFFTFLYFLVHPEVTTLRFSPDSHYFAASSRTKEDVVIDLFTRKKISVPGSIHTAMEFSFTFLGPDRLIGVSTANPKNSPLIEFPSGKVLDHFVLGDGSLVAASNPKYLLIRPVQDRPVGLFSLEQKKFLATNRFAAYDTWDNFTVSERTNGEIGLYTVGKLTPDFVYQLPLGKLPALRAYAASPDLKWIAFSGGTRGGIWDLEKNSRIQHLRGFRNAYYAPNDIFYLEFPSLEKLSRAIVAIRPATAQNKERPIDKDEDARFFGSVYLRTKHNGKNNNELRNVEFEALDMTSLTPLWARSFPKQSPAVSGSPPSGKLIFTWNAKADGLRDEVARDPKLLAAFSKQNLGDSDYFLEVINAREGTPAGGVLLRTGKNSFQPEYQEAAGDWLVVTDNHNRVLLYSISSGVQKAKWFGHSPRISEGGERLCISNGRGHLVVYDLKTLKPFKEFSFANRISAYLFSQDGKKLFVLTNDQSAFILDLAPDSPAPSAVTTN
jgi:WD40 repeat protein